MKPDQAIEFLLNGRKMYVDGVEPTTLLVDYLHRPEIGLTGTKKGCGQGGCGACTVMLSRYDEKTDNVVHTSVNSCMRPLASLDRMAVTTTEHCGNTREGVSQVQWQIAAENGSQCGYCTAGWVMNMHAYLVSKGNEKPSKQEVQGIFDGNICRCTGYRPILYAMQHFAEGFEPHKNAMKCEIDPAEKPPQKTGPLVAPTIPDDWKEPRELYFEGRHHKWFRPLSLESARELIERHASFDNLKLVVGNTSIGIYDLFDENPTVYIDISQLQELRLTQLDDNELTLGAAITYTELLAELTQAITHVPTDQNSVLKALHYMAGRTAGHIVRNAASIAGNTMLVLRHIDEGTPFPSDMFTSYAMAGVDVSVCSSTFDAGFKRIPILEFAWEYARSPELRRDALIVQFHIPFSARRDHSQTYKTALRKENSHSITNAGFRICFDENNNVNDAVLVIGGVGPIAFRAESAERYLQQNPWPDSPGEFVSLVGADVQAVFDDPANIERMAKVPDEGFSNDYRRQLAESYAFKYWIEIAQKLGREIPADLLSAISREPRPISTGTQQYSTYTDEYPVNRPFVKLGAFNQACGEAEYVHDMPLPPRGLHGRFVTSAAAKSSFNYIDYDGNPIDVDQVVNVLRTRFNGIERFVTGVDVPQDNAQPDPSSSGEAPQIDDPIFCIERVTTFGQSIGLILAADPVVAEAAAHDVGTKLIQYNRENPLLSIDEAIAAKSIFQDAGPKQNYPSHIWKIKRADSQLDWVKSDNTATVMDEPCYVVQSELHVGSQIHFYMETQSAMAVPGEDETMVIYSSTQSPDSVQGLVCRILNLTANKVLVRNKRLGGGYGGKTTRSPRAAAAAAVASFVTRRPVHIAMRRESDTAMIGHRHPVQGSVRLAIATGEGPSAPRGKIMGLQADFVLNGGNTYDCSFTISNILQLRCDSAYMIPNYETSSDVAQTNVASNGAFRSVGAIQGVLIIEDAIEKAAMELGIPPETIRDASLYEQGDTVPDGQRLNYCYMREAWEYTRRFANYEERLDKVKQFNSKNKWVKRGISIIPVKYASGYNASFLEQAGAIIEVYSEDGSVLVRQGGVEMGQGLYTKIAQVAAKVLNVPLNLVRIAEMDTGVVPNPVSTGASTGTGFNATAVKEAGEALRKRVQDYAFSLLAANGDEWCKTKNIDFWNYPDEGWRAEVNGNTIWQNIVSKAHSARVNLSAQTRAAIPGGEKPISKENLTFKPDAATMTIDEFTGFTYSAACAEVEIDILTGVTSVVRADIVYDMGKSINPAIDIGQVEGAFVQGLGYVTTEKLVWQQTGPDRGTANTLNTWTYKPPAHTSIPEVMNVDLFPRRDAKSVQENPDLLYSSKEVGEPPLVLATTVFLAIKQAIIASRTERGLSPWTDMNSPATVQAIREACEVTVEELSDCTETVSTESS